MPTRITKAGKPRIKGVIRINGETKEKLFPDDSDASYRQAAAWEQKTRNKILIEEAKAAIDSGCSVLSWATEYLEFSEKTHTEGTFKEKRTAFQRFLRSELVDPHGTVNQITKTVANNYLLGHSDRPGGGVNNDRKNLAAAWSYGVKYLDNFPCDRPNPFHLASERPAAKKPRYVPPIEDFWKIHAAAIGQDKVMLTTYLCLAARRSELFRLKVSDLDFSRNLVQLWTRKRKSGCLEPDWVPMVARLAEELKSWLENRPEESEYVFVCLDPLECNIEQYGQPFKNRQKLMPRLCKKAGVKPFGFHAIRHLTASVLYSDGISVSIIQRILRHLSPMTTIKYLHHLGGNKKALEALEGSSLFSSAAPGPSDSTHGGKVIPLFPKANKKPRQDVASS